MDRILVVLVGVVMMFFHAGHQIGRPVVTEEGLSVIDSIVFDIDNDGEEETCAILPGLTGVFSVVITVSKKTGTEYSSLLLPANGGYADTEFRIADGSLQLFRRVYEPGTDKVIREEYHAVTVRDGDLVIEGFPDRCGPFVCRTGAAVDAPIRHTV